MKQVVSKQSKEVSLLSTFQLVRFSGHVLVTLTFYHGFINWYFVVCDMSRQNNETSFIIDDISSSHLLFILVEAQKEALGPKFADLKLHYVSQGK